MVCSMTRGTGKADQRAGLGDMDVAEHGVGGGHAAGGGVGQHHDIGELRLAQLLHRDGGARHLHQREDAFLHARAAGGGEQNERRPALDRSAHGGDHRFARGRAERAAEEVEILRGGHDPLAFEPPRAGKHGIGQAGLAAGVFQPVGVAALVAELERIERAPRAAPRSRTRRRRTGTLSLAPADMRMW